MRQANWRKAGGESPPERRSNQPRFSASRASVLARGQAKRRLAVHVGGLLSTEKVLVRGAEAFGLVEGNIAGLVMVSGRRAPRCQRTHARMKAFRRDLGGLHPTSDSVPGSRREDRTVVAGDERGGGVRLGHSSCEVGEQGDESPGGVDGAKDRGQREVNGPKHVPDAVPGSRDTGGLRATQACETASCRECG